MPAFLYVIPFSISQRSLLYVIPFSISQRSLLYVIRFSISQRSLFICNTLLYITKIPFICNTLLYITKIPLVKQVGLSFTAAANLMLFLNWRMFIGGFWGRCSAGHYNRLRWDEDREYNTRISICKYKPRGQSTYQNNIFKYNQQTFLYNVNVFIQPINLRAHTPGVCNLSLLYPR